MSILLKRRTQNYSGYLRDPFKVSTFERFSIFFLRVISVVIEANQILSFSLPFISISFILLFVVFVTVLFSYYFILTSLFQLSDPLCISSSTILDRFVSPCKVLIRLIKLVHIYTSEQNSFSPLYFYGIIRCINFITE
jgi:hypothetical protein